ncbi:hypothetical protein FOL47_006297 [Perkinsus chesapeaki]|uniref:Uncharacterized protein n=1 Tax=Perkinsus chesapeaki TaxID=330153 RepID=A0A7J6MXV1_PERCH|nr:hypothetical protein FOL47_006297 [Perkinsus chesapeaki]
MKPNAVPSGMLEVNHWLNELRSHLGPLDEDIGFDGEDRLLLTNPGLGSLLLPPLITVEERLAAKAKAKGTAKKKGKGKKAKASKDDDQTYNLPVGVWGYHEKLPEKAKIPVPIQYMRDSVRVLAAAEEEYPEGPASQTNPSSSSSSVSHGVIVVIDEPWEPPPCECSEDVEDLIDRIGVLRRERKYREAATTLMHARAEWCAVASAGQYIASGFASNNEAAGQSVSLEKDVARPMSRDEDFARPLGDFIPLPVGAPPAYTVVPLDTLQLPNDWTMLLSEDIEKMASARRLSPIPVAAEIYFACELASLAIASCSPECCDKDSVYGTALRLVWSIGCVLSFWANLDDPANFPLNGQVWSSLGYVAFRLGHYDIAAHSYLEARDCREAYSLYKSRENKVCPHTATAYHNIGVCFMELGRDREAFAFLSVAMEALSVSIGDFHPRTRICLRNLHALRDRGGALKALTGLETPHVIRYRVEDTVQSGPTTRKAGRRKKKNKA